MSDSAENILIWGIASMVCLTVLYLAAFLYKKYSKKYREKEERERKAQEEKEKLNELKKAYQNMLNVKSQLKIIKNSSEAVIEKEYSDFISSHKHADKAVVGDVEKGTLLSMQEPEITLEDGTCVMVIKFKRYELKEGISEEQYLSAVEEYQSFKKSKDYHII